MQASATPPASRERKTFTLGTALQKTLLYLLLFTLAALTLFPFYWMFVLATHSQTSIFSAPPPL